MRAYQYALKVISVITLAFFSWTYLSFYQMAAFAATQDSKVTKAQGRQAEKHKPAEKLETLLDDLRKETTKAEGKAAKGEDTATEVESVKARKAEIDTIDTDLKKEFADTEKKLKAANLPKEILDRHNKFAKFYEDSIAELKANVDAIEKAKTPSALTTEFSKTKKHLDKVKPAKKHKPFDPNKLPNRIVKAKERQPKLKKEEWEKELKKESVKEPKKLRAAQRQQQKPIIVASNGPLTGLLSGADAVSVSNTTENYPQLAALSTDGLIQTAQTGSYGKHPFPPEIYPLPWETDMVPEDKQETPETHVTDAIRAKAAELQNNPILMFNWLRNNIYLVPSYGSIQGADMCLQTKQCNATDIASLTIAMFRAADWPARYEFLTAELDIDRFMENMGGFTDPQAAITFAATGGIPVRPVISGGKITSVQFEHVYATALLPMGYYIGVGSLMRRGWSEPMWMPLDVSLKHYVTTPGIDISTAVPFDSQTVVNQIQSTATINEAEGYVTNVNSALIQQTMQDYQTRVQDYISQNTPTATVGDVIGKREIKQYNLPHLYPTGWTKPVTARVRSHTLPDSMKYTVSFILQDADTMETSLSYAINIAEVAGKRVTLSYVPATTTDEQVINNYGGIFNVPAYLVNVKPQIKIEGVVAATGSAIGLGKDQAFNMQFVSPAYGTESVSNSVTAGAYYAIGINPSRISQDLLAQRKAKLESVKDTTCVNNPYSDDCRGELLYSTAMGYFFVINGLEDVAAQSTDVIKMKDVSEAIVSAQVDVSRLFGMPRSIADAGMMIDVDRNIYVALSKNGDQTKVRSFMMSAGQMSSAMEHGIFEMMYQAKGVSTIQVLQLANSQGIPIYTITQNNISNVLPRLQISSEVIIDIQNAVNAGKTVVIPQQNISYYTWTGIGYIVQDPTTGAGAYMISTNLAGGGCCIAAGGLSIILLALIGSTGSGGAHSCTIIDIEHMATPLYFLGVIGIAIGTVSMLVWGMGALVNAGLFLAFAILSPFALLIAIMAAFIIAAMVLALIGFYSNHAAVVPDERRKNENRNQFALCIDNIFSDGLG